jgi:hypothetical protein
MLIKINIWRIMKAKFSTSKIINQVLEETMQAFI